MQRRQLNAGTVCSTQGPSAQRKAFLLNAGGAPGWLDQDLLRELSSEKKPSPWCFFFRRSLFGGTLLFSRLPTQKNPTWRCLFISPNSCRKKPTWGYSPCSRLWGKKMTTWGSRRLERVVWVWCGRGVLVSDGSVGRGGQGGRGRSLHQSTLPFSSRSLFECTFLCVRRQLHLGTFFDGPTRKSPTWWCLLLSNFRQKSNPPGGACGFFKHPMKEIN